MGGDQAVIPLVAKIHGAVLIIVDDVLKVGPPLNLSGADVVHGAS